MLPLLFALSLTLVACGGSDDSGTSDVDGGGDSTAADSAIGDAPKDTGKDSGAPDAPKDTTTPGDTATSDSSTSDTTADDTTTDDTTTADTSSDDTATDDGDAILDVPVDVPEGSLESGAACTSDLECAVGLKCCYPCGIPGCTNECIPPGPGGSCPLFP
jgi:hypothetical protein